MTNTISESSYNITPYLFNNSYNTGTKGASSHKNNSDVVDVDLNSPKSEISQENPNLYVDNNINNLKYENTEGYCGVYSPGNIIYGSKYKSNASDVDDYQKINTANYYLSGINAYNTNFVNGDDNIKNDDLVKYNTNVNLDYTGTDPKFPITEAIYPTNDNNYPNEIYNGSYVGFGAGNYYSTDIKQKYPLYTPYPTNTDYSNNVIPIENLPINVDNKLGSTTNYYGLQYPLSNQNIKNETNHNYNNNNNGYYTNQYDFDGIKNNSISGVKYQRTDNRWIARWTTAQGKRACKSFSVNIYGFDQAKMLAIQARQKGVALSGRSFCNRERQHAMKSGVGIIGIRFDKTQARWVSSYYEGGKRKFRYFTVKDYGYEQAKRNAIIWKSCHDERLLKKFNQNLTYTYDNNNKLTQNMMYPVTFNPNDNENYMVDNGNSNDLYSPTTGTEYVDANGYNTYTSNTEYSNASNFSNMSNFTIKDNYTTDINGNYLLADFPHSYGEEYNNNSNSNMNNNSIVNINNDNNNIGSVDYHLKTDYSNLPIPDYRNINGNDNYEAISAQGSNTQPDDKYLIWDKENIQSYMTSGDNIRIDYNKIYQLDENDGFTNTTIGSDNGDNKSNGSFDYDEHFNQSDINQQYINNENNYNINNINDNEYKENDKNKTPEVTYDRKKGRWITTIIDNEGKSQSTYFPVSKHGYRKAKQLALSAITELKKK